MISKKDIRDFVSRLSCEVDVKILRRVFSMLHSHTPPENMSDSWYLMKIRSSILGEEHSSDEPGQKIMVGDVFSREGETLTLTSVISQGPSVLGLFYSDTLKRECAFELQSMIKYRIKKVVIPQLNSNRLRKSSVQVNTLHKGTSMCSRGCGKKKHRGTCESRKVFYTSQGHSLCNSADTGKKSPDPKIKIEDIFEKCPKCVEGRRKRKGHKGAHTRLSKSKIKK